MNINVSPKRVVYALLLIVSLMLVFNLISLILVFQFGFDASVKGFIPFFKLVDFNNERNIPTLYSSTALIFSSALLAIIAITHRRLGNSYWHWVGLAAIFLFLAIDETATVHEKLIRPIQAALDTSGIFLFAWVIPYSLALIVFIVAYLKFLINLPRKTMILFIVAGSFFVFGALGVEMLSGQHIQSFGADNLGYGIYYTFEELLEMLGIIIFIYALLSYITTQFNTISITIVNPNNEDI